MVCFLHFQCGFGFVFLVQLASLTGLLLIAPPSKKKAIYPNVQVSLNSPKLLYCSLTWSNLIFHKGCKNWLSSFFLLKCLPLLPFNLFFTTWPQIKYVRVWAWDTRWDVNGPGSWCIIVSGAVYQGPDWGLRPRRPPGILIRGLAAYSLRSRACQSHTHLSFRFLSQTPFAFTHTHERISQPLTLVQKRPVW